jgi:deazaflavin-dependent oxidoreductase (nitroreductase family)
MSIKEQNGQGGFLHRVRRFNKASFNPLTLKFAGRYVYAAVHHVGRRSGRAYTTPVFALPIAGGFIIALPFGANVDWCRNVLVAGYCRIQWRGANYIVKGPEVIAAHTAGPLLPAWARLAIRPVRALQFLTVHQTIAAEN